MRIKNFLFCVISALFLFSVYQAVAQDISVQITDPSRDGVEIHKTRLVKGIASIPSGSHLWVFARRADFEGVWWPQGEGKVNPSNNEWQVSVTFGTAEDIGWDFDIAVAVVSENSHSILKDYRIKAMKTGEWRPIEMPQVLTAPVLRKVKKVGD
jgi:hypothetical protein